jgi:hypothetical protein
VNVDAGSFSPYFRAEVAGLDRRNGTLALKLTRTAAFPRDEAALDALYADPPMPAAQAAGTSPATATAPATKTTAAPATATAPAVPPQPMSLVRRRLAVEALAKGFVWLEFRDQGGNVIGGAPLRVDLLQRVESLDAAVPAPIVDRQAVAPARIDVLPQ